MKTSKNPAESFKPTLLDQLREKSEALRAGQRVARKPMEEAFRDIDRILLRTFRWLDEVMSHLEVIRPHVGHVFHLPNILTLDRPAFDRGFVSFRRRPLIGLEVLDHLEMFYRMQGEGTIALRINANASQDIEARLRSSSLPYQYQTEQDDKGVVRFGLFRVQPQISASVRFEPDYPNDVIQVRLRNVDRFETVFLDFVPGKLNEAALEDLVKLMMGEASGFLRRAPLALIRGRHDEPDPAPAEQEEGE